MTEKSYETLRDEEIETKLSFLGTEISDLFQRYGHALDRIIALEEKVHLLQGSAK